MGTLWDRALERGLDPATTILPHTGGRDVLDALEERFPGRTFPESREILRKHGNMSSPSVLYVLREYLTYPLPRVCWICQKAVRTNYIGHQELFYP